MEGRNSWGKDVKSIISETTKSGRVPKIALRYHQHPWEPPTEIPVHRNQTTPFGTINELLVLLADRVTKVPALL
jgi:hypothetical protein